MRTADVIDETQGGGNDGGWEGLSGGSRGGSRGGGRPGGGGAGGGGLQGDGMEADGGGAGGWDERWGVVCAAFDSDSGCGKTACTSSNPACLAMEADKRRANAPANVIPRPIPKAKPLTVHLHSERASAFNLSYLVVPIGPHFRT